MNFIEFASKAQEELNRERGIVEADALKVRDGATANSIRSNELDKREGEMALKERGMLERNENMVAWEAKKVKEEEVQKMFDEANAKLVEVDKKLKLSMEKDSDADQKLADVLKRENALSDREKVYREEITKEIASKALGVKL